MAGAAASAADLGIAPDRTYSDFAQMALDLGKATIQRAYIELEAKGFIVLQTAGNWYNRRAHEWRLTTKPTETPKGSLPASNEWRMWKPKTERGSDTDPSPRPWVRLRTQDPALGPLQNPSEAFPRPASVLKWNTNIYHSWGTTT